MEVCKTDMQTIIKYLGDAAKMYDTLPGRCNARRAWSIRFLIRKLNKKLKLSQTIKINSDEKK
ncbi:MAG: hypothetical protein Q4D56_06260 [Bacteroides sp.]|nr:hypothetical protein [Bacteroides sp.]